jgi:hypothetical protein
MDWVRHSDEQGYSIEHPAGWDVQNFPGRMVIVRAPDRQCVVAIEMSPRIDGAGSGATTDASMRGISFIAQRRFSSRFLFDEIENDTTLPLAAGAVGFIRYRTRDGSPGRARVIYEEHGNRATSSAAGAPAALFDRVSETLVRIVQSFRRGAVVEPLGAAVARASGVGPLAYRTFAEPQTAAFSFDVPVGWNMRGGLAHPSPGDRRVWFEMQSTEGVYLLSDPGFPQNLCHYRDQLEGHYAQTAVGIPLLNLKPSAARLNDYYLKSVGLARFGKPRAQQRRARPDMVALLQRQFAEFAGQPVPRSFQITADEVVVDVEGQGGPLVVSLLALAAFNGEYAMGMWAQWDGSITMYAAPPAAAARAEDVRSRLRESLKFTPKWVSLVQADEAAIVARSNAANAAQWNWFAGEQAAHVAQERSGDAFVAGYWNQQAANDSLARSWDNEQAVNDRLAQNYDDALTGRERLADDSTGRAYDVPAGYEYYWIDRRSNTIYGTNTAEPPDYRNDYTQLRER